ncbi:hypothetical protein [Agaricicola taiwanensis]|uniref:hypothetical protein n=1 Tax=Agaricicola taiwanensis TaxID=591372 RepID=UPI00166F30E1|nr:hypothetical protein [Agaricicola taiwanensis]
MLRRLVLIAAAVVSLGIGGSIASAVPAAAQGFYFGFHDGPGYRHHGPRHRHWRHGPPPRYYHGRRHRPRNCERVRVRFFDGYSWRVRTERRCYRGW